MKLFFSFLVILFISALSVKRTNLKSFALGTKEKQQNCTQPSLLLNRGTGYYLGVGAVFETIGFQAVLDYNYTQWCVQNGSITNINNGLVLDVFEQNLCAKQIVLWTSNGSNNADQLWTITLENTGFWSIVSVIQNKNLTLAAVNQYNYTQGLTLKKKNINDVSQQWTLAPQ